MSAKDISQQPSWLSATADSLSAEDRLKHSISGFAARQGTFSWEHGIIATVLAVRYRAGEECAYTNNVSVQIEFGQTFKMSSVATAVE